MKNFLNSTLFLLFVCLGLFWSCVDKNDVGEPKVEEGIESFNISESFNFETIDESHFDFTLKFQDQEVTNTLISVYNGLPPTTYEPDSSLYGQLIASGYTDEQGRFSGDLNLANNLEEVFVQVSFPGLPPIVKLPLENGSISAEISDETASYQILTDNSNDQSNQRTARVSRTYSYMGSYNSLGVPDYLEGVRDVISLTMLEDINVALPERAPVPKYHPEYIKDGVETDLKLQDDMDVWVTFVAEGAGYRNSLGYYTYDVNDPPATPDDIQDLIVIFPNTSLLNSGGGLLAGDKVHLGNFEAGTGIGWFLVADAWNGTDVGDGKNIFFSDPDLNPENNSKKRNHNVLLNDIGRNLFLMGFEDIHRQGGSDDDFNDAIFYISTSKYESVATAEMETVRSSEQDSDGDGTIDSYDKYPNNSSRSFDNFYPGETQFGSLAYEDLWPNKGDYDFNDLVLDYRFNQITNKQNKVVEIEAKFLVKAIGAGFSNGFGFQLNIDPGLIQQVSGQSLEENFIVLNGNNTEAGQSKATIIVFDNAYNILPHPGGQEFVNTEPNTTFVNPDTITISIVLTSPQQVKDIGLPPYNPFLIVNKERGKEVHLPGYSPTDLANSSYFKTGIDDTEVEKGKYYKSDGNLPWGINFPESFDYPEERTQLPDAYLTFKEWVESDGFSRQDWYKENLGYRNSNKIYKKNK